MYRSNVRIHDGKALRSYQIRDLSLCNLARLIVPTAFMLQDTTVDVTSRGLCLLMYWLGVGCVLLVDRRKESASLCCVGLPRCAAQHVRSNPSLCLCFWHKSCTDREQRYAL